jgi:hypothetical protein
LAPEIVFLSCVHVFAGQASPSKPGGRSASNQGSEGKASTKGGKKQPEGKCKRGWKLLLGFFLVILVQVLLCRMGAEIFFLLCVRVFAGQPSPSTPSTAISAIAALQEQLHTTLAGNPLRDMITAMLQTAGSIQPSLSS